MCSCGVPGAGEAGNSQPQGNAALAVASAGCVTMLLPCNVLLISLPNSSHSPLGCQAGVCFGWGLPLVADAELEESRVPSISKCLEFGHMSFLLTWHHCRHRMLRLSP